MGEIRGGLSYVRYENSAPQGLPQLINLLSSPHASGEAGEREKERETPGCSTGGGREGQIMDMTSLLSFPFVLFPFIGSQPSRLGQHRVYR